MSRCVGSFIFIGVFNYPSVILLISMFEMLGNSTIPSNLRAADLGEGNGICDVSLFSPVGSASLFHRFLLLVILASSSCNAYWAALFRCLIYANHTGFHMHTSR